MNVKGFLDIVKKKLKPEGYKLSNFKEIQNGLQFSAVKNNSDCKLIIFRNKDIGPWLYTGHVKEDKYRKEIDAIFVKPAKQKNLKNISASYPVYDQDIFDDVEIFLNDIGAEKEGPFYADNRIFFRVESLTVTFHKRSITVQGKSKISGKVMQTIKSTIDDESIEEAEAKTIVSDNRQSLFSTENDWDLIAVEQYGGKSLFGPIIIAALYIDKEAQEMFDFFGIKYKRVFNNRTFERIAGIIRDECKYRIVTIDNDLYNGLHEYYKDYNKLMGWGHATAATEISEEINFNYALTNNSNYLKHIEDSLLEKEEKIKFRRASNKKGDQSAVAAAKILAENEYLNNIKKLI